MTTADPELLADFVVETMEHLDDVERNLLALETCPETTDVEMIHNIFRRVHSIKGVAAFLGLTDVAALTHQQESVLNVLRSDNVIPSPQLISRLLPSFDMLKELIRTPESTTQQDISQHILELSEIFHSLQPGNAVPEVVSDRQMELKPNPHVPDLEKPTPIAPSIPNHFEPPLPKAETPHIAAEKAREVDAQSSKPAKPAASADTTIRVPVAILDRLMNLTGELVLGRNQLLQMIARRSFGELPTVGLRLDQVTSELQEAVMHSRMQPVGTVLNRFPRLVRDLNQKLGKQCQLIIEGGEVELDKTILENIADPLTHLVRNSLDHAIETPSNRKLAGKTEQGTLRLRAYHQAGKVHLTLSDDGAGIDPARVRDKAFRKGLITADQASSMSVRDSIHLIFQPGFSTAEAVTEVSGRGVGMDVVRTNIESLGGTVEIESTVGEGTTVHLTLPLTLAIIPSLIVTAGSERFAIPEPTIVELVRVTPKECLQRIERMGQSEALRLRGSLLPLIRLSELLNVDRAAVNHPERKPKSKATPQRRARKQRKFTTATDTTLNIIVLEGGIARYGLIVDSVLDPEQIVVKPLGNQLKDCRCLSGVTVLGDGDVAFILDIAGIATTSLLGSSLTTSAGKADKSQATLGEEMQSMLMLGNEQGELFAVPMAMVTRIERIESHQIERVGTQLLLQYRGGTLPLIELSTTPRTATNESLYALVFIVDGQETAIIAPQLVDIRDVTTKVQQCPSQGGVVGTIIVEGKIIRVIDLFELVAEQPGSKKVDGVRKSAHRKATATILVADDSPFFRTQVVKFLESQGHTVIACEDGQDAWETLSGGSTKFDLVVTDLEMPKLNGFGLCRRIRQSESFAKLPVIMLTSMNDSRNVLEGTLAGVNDYQVKMDRSRLLESVSRLVRETLVKQ